MQETRSINDFMNNVKIELISKFFFNLFVPVSKLYTSLYNKCEGLYIIHDTIGVT